jgi:hypothetical protein
MSMFTAVSDLDYNAGAVEPGANDDELLEAVHEAAMAYEPFAFSCCRPRDVRELNLLYAELDAARSAALKAGVCACAVDAAMHDGYSDARAAARESAQDQGE